ncbi:MAG: hypothetical protein IJC50_01315 [Clostridia bacterium]|nr:hypothetical protein [Clostridia bacterium]
MKITKMTILFIIYIIVGVTLLTLGIAGVIDEFWQGMGGGLLIIGILRSIQSLRYSKDENYRESYNTELNDERNRFIRNKAWAWAGYMFVIIAAIATLVLQTLGERLLSLAVSAAVGLILILYWISYFILQRKY